MGNETKRIEWKGFQIVEDRSVPEGMILVHDAECMNMFQSGAVGYEKKDATEQLWPTIDRMIVDAWKIGLDGETLDMLAMRARFDEAVAAQTQRGLEVGGAVTDEDVERACRAICARLGHDPDDRCRYTGGKLVRDKHGNTYPYWTTYKRDARTVLESFAARRADVPDTRDVLLGLIDSIGKNASGAGIDNDKRPSDYKAGMVKAYEHCLEIVCSRIAAAPEVTK